MGVFFSGIHSQGNWGPLLSARLSLGLGWNVSILSGAWAPVSAQWEGGQEGGGRHSECAVAPGGGEGTGPGGDADPGKL